METCVFCVVFVYSKWKTDNCKSAEEESKLPVERAVKCHVDTTLLMAIATKRREVDDSPLLSHLAV